jgi:hypothetical protein
LAAASLGSTSDVALFQTPLTSETTNGVFAPERVAYVPIAVQFCADAHVRALSEMLAYALVLDGIDTFFPVCHVPLTSLNKKP